MELLLLCCSLNIYVSVTLQITLETLWCVACERRCMIKNTTGAKGMLVLRGPHIIKCADLHPLSKKNSLLRCWYAKEFVVWTPVHLCSISVSCVSIRNSFVITLIDPCRETLKAHSGGINYNIKEGGCDVGLSCHKSMAQCAVKHVWSKALSEVWRGFSMFGFIVIIVNMFGGSKYLYWCWVCRLGVVNKNT